MLFWVVKVEAFDHPKHKLSMKDSKANGIKLYLSEFRVRQTTED